MLRAESVRSMSEVTPNVPPACPSSADEGGAAPALGTPASLLIRLVGDSTVHTEACIPTGDAGTRCGLLACAADDAPVAVACTVGGTDSSCQLETTDG